MTDSRLINDSTGAVVDLDAEKQIKSSDWQRSRRS